MTQPSVTPQPWNPGIPFYIGLGVVMLALTAPLPAWTTFIHMWRVEIAASVFLFSTLAYLTLNPHRLDLRLSKTEWRFIVLPLLVFIFWSGLSALWAPSWKSAIHHTLIWGEYLIFYLIFRYLLDNGRHFGRLLRLFALVLVVFAILALFDFLSITAFGGNTSFRVRFAKYGEQIVTLLPLLLVFVLRSSGRTIYLGLTSVVLMWLLIYSTAGRVNWFLFGAVLISMAVLIFAFARFRRYGPKFALAVVLIAAAPVPLFLFSLVTSSAEVPILARLNDTSGSEYSNNFRRLLNSVSFEMLRSAPINGVGADNYGFEFNNFREQYAQQHPEDPNLIYGEVGIAAHAHNEFIQIAAELGVTGAVIFLWFLVGIGIMAFRALRDFRGVELHALAALIGLLMFLASSAVSAYSFRVMQNGLLFFFVLAVASKALLKRNESLETASSTRASTARTRLVLAGGMVVCIALLVYTGIRLTSVIIATQANRQKDFESGDALFKAAAMFDDENPDCRRTLGMLLLKKKRYAEAIPWLEESIALGRGESTDFSYLASAFSLSGDDVAAEHTMAKAATLYPRSPFVLTRYGELLERNGKIDDSVAIFRKASAIDARAAATWRVMVTSGPKAVSDLAARDNSYLQVMELHPESSIYAVTTERYIRFPEEQRFSLIKISSE